MASLGTGCALRDHAWRVLPALRSPLAFMASMDGPVAPLLESLDASGTGFNPKEGTKGFSAGMVDWIDLLPDLSLLDHDGDLGRLGSSLSGGRSLSIALGHLCGISAEAPWKGKLRYL